MEFNRIVIVTKMTGLEYFLRTNGLHSFSEAERELTRRNINAERIISSHYRQIGKLHSLYKVLDDQKIHYTSISRNEINKASILPEDVVISFGGDNHFVYTAHFTDSPILALNSDPETSSGHLLQDIPIQNVPRVIQEANFYSLVLCPRIVAFIDGKEIESATQEIYFGESHTWLASYNTIAINEGGFRVPVATHRGGGTLLVNGMGSTGWYKNAGGTKESGPGHLWLSCLGMGQFTSLTQGTEITKLGYLQEFIITSNNDTKGVAVVDSLDDFKYPFPAGAEAHVFLTDSRHTSVIKAPKYLIQTQTR